MSRDSTKKPCGDTDESSLERRDEGTPTRRLTFPEPAIETPTVVAQTPQTTSPDADVTPTSDSSMSEISPGSRASVSFFNRFALPELSSLSADNREDHLKAMGRATSEACADGGCKDVGEFWASMPRENLEEYAQVLFELSKVE
jgi:hypothetical protein